MAKGSFFALMSRMKYINRWGLKRNMRTENLAEHSLETVYIAHALALLHNSRCGGGADPARAALMAAYHDASEILTGDMPTPIKYRNEEIRTAYKAVESSFQRQLLDSIPDDIRGEYVGLLEHGGTSIEAKLVKAADKISALIKCREELSVGNRDFELAELGMVEAIRNLHLEAADIFMDEYMGYYFQNFDLLME